MKVKAYVRFDERNKVHFHREFEVVEKLPAVGEVDENRHRGERTTIKAIREVGLDCEQGSDEVYNYAYFAITKLEEQLNDEDQWEFYEENVEYVAIAKELGDED